MAATQLRYSPRRELIYQWVRAHAVHPTAAMVYAGLSPDYPQLSLATVYRNLNQLSQEGRLRRIPMPDGCDRFDGNLIPHAHITCRCCGGVTDVLLPEGPLMEQLVTEETGYRLDPMELVLSGVCPECQHHHYFQEDEQNGTQRL